MNDKEHTDENVNQVMDESRHYSVEMDGSDISDGTTKNPDEQVQGNLMEEVPVHTNAPCTTKDDVSSMCESVEKMNVSSKLETNDDSKQPLSTEVISSTALNDGDISNAIKKQKIHCIAVGNAPLMKKTKFLCAHNEPFGAFQQRLHKMLHLPKGSSLFMYIQQSFVPSPDDLIGDLGNFFSVKDELQIHYSIQEAWG